MRFLTLVFIFRKGKKPGQTVGFLRVDDSDLFCCLLSQRQLYSLAVCADGSIVGNVPSVLSGEDTQLTGRLFFLCGSVSVVSVRCSFGWLISITSIDIGVFTTGPRVPASHVGPCAVDWATRLR